MLLCSCEIPKLAYGIVFLVRKKGGKDNGQLYAMKILKKSAIVQKVKTAEHTKTERQVSKVNGVTTNSSSKPFSMYKYE